MLSADVTSTDRARAGRALLAWLTGDRLALDAALDDAINEQAGVPSLLFALLDITATLVATSGGIDDAVRQIQRALLAIATDDDEQG